MLKICNGCKGRHVGPFGSLCEHIQVVTMEEGRPYKDQQDPAYLTYLETQIEQACSRSANDSQSISTLVARMDKLEVTSRGRKGSTNPFVEDFYQNAIPAGTVGHVADMSGQCLTGLALDLHGSLKGASSSDLVGGPLTSALRQLSQAIDPSPVTHKGIMCIDQNITFNM